jgi:hypothetical protein
MLPNRSDRGFVLDANLPMRSEVSPTHHITWRSHPSADVLLAPLQCAGALNAVTGGAPRHMRESNPRLISGIASRCADRLQGDWEPRPLKPIDKQKRERLVGMGDASQNRFSDQNCAESSPDAGPQPEGLPDISRGSQPGEDPR